MRDVRDRQTGSENRLAVQSTRSNPLEDSKTSLEKATCNGYSLLIVQNPNPILKPEFS